MTDVPTLVAGRTPVAPPELPPTTVMPITTMSIPASPRMGDLLLRAGLITDVQLGEALAAQGERRKRLGEILREDGVLDEIELAAVLAVQLDTPLVDLRERPSDDGAMRLLGEADARRLWVIPLAFAGTNNADLVVATDDPSNQTLLDEVELIVGRQVIPMLSLRSEIDDAIRHRYRVTGDLEAQVSAFASRRPVVAPAPTRSLSPRLEGLQDAPVVQIVNLLVAQALRDRASDLHLEPHATGLRIRARVDGILREVAELPADLAPGLVSRIKILAELNIVEKQRAQDGQITFDIDGRNVDVRVATMRTIWGEKVVMRLLDRDRSVLRLTQLGVPADVRPVYQKLLASRYGMVIVAGPTGSGKTTTLYASISELDRAALNVTTIEDPVEYTFENVNQTQVNAAAHLTFALGLRAILRQDPDVILVGEMRDRETAEIAVQASMTGHLVLLSMHATDAVSALFRLLEMGIEPFLVSASLTGVIGQRLMRRVCSHCRIEIEPTAEEVGLYESSGLPAIGHAYLGRGCTYCAGTGYLDRIGAYELLRVTPDIRRLIASNAHYDEIRNQALSDGMVPMRTDALRKAAAGVTTVSEFSQGSEQLMSALSKVGARAGLGSAKPKKNKTNKPNLLERLIPGLNSMKRVELVLFSRMMATFIRAGIPILDGIEVVRQQAVSTLFRRTLDDIAIQLRNGEQLSMAMASHPRVFSRLYIDMIVAAEATGELDAILDQLARYLERAEATARRLRQAMLYPAIVMCMAAVVIAILTTVVLPSFVALFADFDAELPLPTKIMMAVGSYGGSYGVQTVGVVLVFFALLTLVRDTRIVRRMRQRVILHVPVIGGIVKLGIETRFARTLGILLRAGVPIARAFDIATTGTGNVNYIKRLAPVRERLLSGDGITEPLKSSGLFGSLLIQMVKVGEETGTLDRYLDQAAEFMDDDLDYRTKQMVTIIEPMLILGVALVVGFVALSVVTPMYGILNEIK